MRCPRCPLEATCTDWNEVDIGVGVQVFDEQYTCPEHGLFGFSTSTGLAVFQDDGLAVTCDETNNSPGDLAAGKLRVDVAIPMYSPLAKAYVPGILADWNHASPLAKLAVDAAGGITTAMGETIIIDGVEYEVARRISGRRVIVDYGGLFVLADDNDEGWTLSGDPATPEEASMLRELTAGMEDKTILTVTKDDER